MHKETGKIIAILLAVLVLELPLFFLWRWYDGNRVKSEEVRIRAAETTAPAGRPTVPPATEAAEQTEMTAKTEVWETVETTKITEASEASDSKTAAEETKAREETAPKETKPSRPEIKTVPQYYQNDYPEEPYSFSNVAQSGSSMTALAMVASYMTDHEYYPDQMADWLAHFLGGDYKRLEYGSDLLKLSWKRAENIHESLQAVREGRTVILMFNKNNMFTWKEHYVVLTGVNSEGKILLLDTDRDNYDKNYLKQFYEGGFTEKDLLRGYSCGWIYDKSKMPEDPFLYEPEPPAKASRYPGLELTDEERNMIAKLICMEAASEPFEGQQAVAEVILNRLASGRFQNSIHNIIHAEGQFPSVKYLYKAKPDYSQYKAIEQAQFGPYVLPENVVFYAKFKVNDQYWGKIGNHHFCYSY